MTRRKEKREPMIAENETRLVNEFAEQHGQYEQLGRYGDARHVRVNRGGTAIERWLNATPAVFTEPESTAIRYCQALWHRLDRKDSGPSEIRIAGRYLWIGQSEHEALAELAHIQGEGRNRIPQGMWSMFEDVCRFHVGAAEAGSLYSSNARSAVDTARIYTKTTASIVAVRLGL